MRKRIEITTVERERIVRIYGQMPCPACEERKAKKILKLIANGIAFLKTHLFKSKEKNK